MTFIKQIEELVGLLPTYIHWFKNSNETYLGLNFKAQASPSANVICVKFALLHQKCSHLPSTLPSLCQRYRGIPQRVLILPFSAKLKKQMFSSGFSR